MFAYRSIRRIVTSTFVATLGASAALTACTVANAGETRSHQDPPTHAARNSLPAIVSHIKVLSDKVPDVSSVEAWRNSFIRDGMTDDEKALAIWKSVVSFRHQDIPPNEY